MYFKGNAFLALEENGIFSDVKKFMDCFAIGGEIFNKLGMDGLDIKYYSLYIIETAYTAGYDDCSDILANAPADKKIKFSIWSYYTKDIVILVNKRKEGLEPALYTLSKNWHYELFVELPDDLGNEILNSIHTLAENAYNAGYDDCMNNFFKSQKRGKKNEHKKTPC